MPATRYMRYKDMLREYMQKSGTQISFVKLRKEIIRHIGSSEYRIIRPSIMQLKELNLIKDCGNYFEINKKEVLQ